MTNVKLPCDLTAINSDLFSECTNLRSIDFPDALISIGQSAFNLCTSLTEVKIPESVTEIDRIAFSSCSSLTTVTLPASLASIGEEAFRNCENITAITYNAITPVTAFDNVFAEKAYESAKLTMPNATLASVQATVPWKNFQHIVAKDASVGMGLAAGEDFEYDGIIYTVYDSKTKTCHTKSGEFMQYAGNVVEGDITIPAIV